LVLAGIFCRPQPGRFGYVWSARDDEMRWERLI
jgi:hypothetical protein